MLPLQSAKGKHVEISTSVSRSYGSKETKNTVCLLRAFICWASRQMCVGGDIIVIHFSFVFNYFFLFLFTKQVTGNDVASSCVTSMPSSGQSGDQGICTNTLVSRARKRMTSETNNGGRNKAAELLCLIEKRLISTRGTIYPRPWDEIATLNFKSVYILASCY